MQLLRQRREQRQRPSVVLKEIIKLADTLYYRLAGSADMMRNLSDEQRMYIVQGMSTLRESLIRFRERSTTMSSLRRVSDAVEQLTGEKWTKLGKPKAEKKTAAQLSWGKAFEDDLLPAANPDYIKYLAKKYKEVYMVEDAVDA